MGGVKGAYRDLVSPAADYDYNSGSWPAFSPICAKATAGFQPLVSELHTRVMDR